MLVVSAYILIYFLFRIWFWYTNHHHLFGKCHFFHAELGLDICPIWSPLHTSLKIAHSGCRPNSFILSLAHSSHFCCPCPYISPHHLHFSVSPHAFILTLLLYAQSISICHASLHQPHPEGCINPHCTFYPYRTLLNYLLNSLKLILFSV